MDIDGVPQRGKWSRSCLTAWLEGTAGPFLQRHFKKARQPLREFAGSTCLLLFATFVEAQIYATNAAKFGSQASRSPFSSSMVYALTYGLLDLVFNRAATNERPKSLEESPVKKEIAPAHFNPAITIALVIRRSISLLNAVLCIVAQCTCKMSSYYACQIYQIYYENLSQ